MNRKIQIGLVYLGVALMVVVFLRGLIGIDAELTERNITTQAQEAELWAQEAELRRARIEWYRSNTP